MKTKEQLADRVLSTGGLKAIDISASAGDWQRWICKQVDHDTLYIACYRTWHSDIGTTHTMRACRRCKAFVHKTFEGNPLPNFPQDGDMKHEDKTSWIWNGVDWELLIKKS